MADYTNRIVRIISAASRPMDDDEIAQRMGIVRQNVNQICRRLEVQGILRRVVGPAGKIVNELVNRPGPSSAAPASGPVVATSTLRTEDDVKRAVATHLEARGYTSRCGGGHNRGHRHPRHRTGATLGHRGQG